MEMSCIFFLNNMCIKYLNKLSVAGLVFFVIFLIDQYTKHLVVINLAFSARTICFIPGLFNLVYVENYAAAFGFLSFIPVGVRLKFLLGLNVLACAFLLVYMLQIGNFEIKGDFWGFSAMIGGGVSNMYDRIVYGYVIDFFDIYFMNYHWPTFNCADIFIVLGAGCLVYYHVSSLRERKAN